MNIKPQTLDKRRAGNTTRLIDYYIQELFEAFFGDKGPIEIKDHLDDKDSHINLVKILKTRVRMEHNFRVMHDKEKGLNWYFLIRVE